MGQIEIAVSILSALLTGGFILFFIESQHIEQVVNDKFRSIMNPYYHKLSALMVVMYLLQLRFNYPTKNTPSEKLIKDIGKLGESVYVSGRDTAYVNSEKLTALNEKISNIWYYCEAGHYNDIKFDIGEHYVYQKEEIYRRIKEISILYSKYSFDKYLLPKIAGQFYFDVWLKVEDVTFKYESWQKKCKSNRNKILFSIILVMLTLVFAMMLHQHIDSYLFAIATTVCCIFFVFNLLSLLKLLKLSNEIFN